MKIQKIALAALLAAALTGCSNKSGGAKTDFSSAEVPIKIEKEADGEYASYGAMKEAFTPDFSFKYEEEEDEGEYIEEPGKKSAKKGKSESAVPGIRELSKYKTKYSEKRTKIEYPAVQEAEEKIDPKKPFKIEEWGPQGELAAEESRPAFFVVFSQPVKSLAALGEPTQTCDAMSVEPPLKGRYRWLGSRHLCFEASAAADPSVQYTIRVNKSLKSLAGKSLEGATEFSTRAAPLKFIRLDGGYIKDSESAYSEKTGALPQYANRAFVRLNYALGEGRLLEVLRVTVGGKKKTFSAAADYNQKAFPWSGNQIFDEANKKSNSFVVTIDGQIPNDEKIEFTLEGSGEKKSFSSLKPFEIDELPKTAGYARGTRGNSVTIVFTQKVDPETVAQNISFDFDYKFSKSDFEIAGRSLTIYDLPISYQDGKDNKFKVFIKAGLKDLYGQSLKTSGGAKVAEVSVPAPKSYVKFTDYGARLLESQFKPKLYIESQNILQPSFYKAQKTTNPLYTECRFSDLEEAPAGATLLSLTKNQRQFEEIDLSPLLDKDGFGWIDFEARVMTNEWNGWEEKYQLVKNERKITIQVTDFGITARIGINKAVVMARSLKEKKPIEGAEILILAPREEKDDGLDLDGGLIAQGKTDKNGFAEIEFSEEQVKKIEAAGRDSYIYSLRIFARKGSDKAVFYPASHNPWRHNIPTNDLNQARKAVTRAFIFTDRGLYKPGETVSFRGIVRDQTLGRLVPCSDEPYVLTVAENKWEGKEIMPQMEGRLSQSGGFYGSFKLPDQIEPGNYKIRYKKSQYEWEDPYVDFTVANFERLKFEASISTPKIQRYGGEKLSANLRASYLAGGNLSGAQYETSWFKQAAKFEPDTAETRGCHFGPTNSWYGRSLVANEKGLLSGDGQAGLSCASEKISDGMPYIYRVEANVTDVSNQRISTQKTIFVHPAKFYVGIKKPAALSGFAKKGDKLEFPFILVDAEGKPLEGAGLVSSIEYKLEREVWTMANEQSVDDSIYTRWEKTEELEAQGKLEPAAAGKISLEMKEAGWMTLTVLGRDASGNLTKSQLDFYVTGGGSSWHDRYNSQSINLTPDKSMYNPGDKARILMESPLPAGDYLITLEREGIFTQEVRRFDSPSSVIEIPVSVSYTPVVYAAVSSFSVRSGEPTHQYGEPDLDKPKGYFGVASIFVNPKAKSFNVKIESDKKVYKPGETATITLTATRGGKPVEGAELTLMAVDRGVLDLIDYHVPNPIEFFYNKWNFPLCVMGGDSRDMLMDPVTYSVKNLLGGDSDEEEKGDGDARTDFRPTALFEPLLTTDKNGKAVCTFTMPDSLTAYRLTAFGVKEETFALKEGEVKVQNQINVQQVQPRRLRERDTAECGVLITNLDAKGQKVTVSLEAASPTANTAQDELEGRATIPGKAFVDGAAEKTVFVAAEDSTVAFFDVAAQESGTVELRYKIKSSVLDETLVSPIIIEKTFVYESATLSGATSGQESEAENERIVIPSWAKEGRGELALTLDTSRLGPLGSAVQYLFDYPYGCLEQRASKALSLLLFAPYIDAFEMQKSVSDPKKCALNEIKSWAKFQHSNGGFPYWPEDAEGESLFASIRIANACAAAKKAGLNDKDLKLDIDALKDFIKRGAQKAGVSDSEKTLACKTFALLEDQRMDQTLMELNARLDELSLGAIADVGTAFAIKGDKARAEAAAKKIRAFLQPSLRGVSVTEKNQEGYYWLCSSSERLAKILSLFVELEPDDSMVDRLVFSLLKEESKGYWKNTAATAGVLEALSNYIQRRDIAKTDCAAKAFLNKTEIMSEKFKGAAAKPQTLKLPFEDKFISSLPCDKMLPLSFEKTGSGRLYYTARLTYALPDEAQAARDEGIKVSVSIADCESEKELQATAAADARLNLASSKLYKATVTLSSTRDRDYLALRCPIPSGAEILDSTFVTSGSAAESETSGDWRHWISNKTVRDNEIQFFWNSFKSGETTVTFTFRAARRGVYPTPPIQAECMYEPEIFGRSDGNLFVIE